MLHSCAAMRFCSGFLPSAELTWLVVLCAVVVRCGVRATQQWSSNTGAPEKVRGDVGCICLHATTSLSCISAETFLLAQLDQFIMHATFVVCF